MKPQCEYPFTARQFEALAEEGRRAVQAVAQYLTGSAIERSDQALSDALNLMKPSEGCVPSEEVGDDLLTSVRRKFAAVYQAAIELAEAELRKRGLERRRHFNFCLVIEPSYEDATHVVIVDYDKPICYLHEWNKAWHVGFSSLAALAKAVLSAKTIVVRRVKDLT